MGQEPGLCRVERVRMDRDGAAGHEAVTLRSLLEEPLLRAATVHGARDADLDRPVSWCLAWAVAARGTETVQDVLVHLEREPSRSVLDALCSDLPGLGARSVAALAVNAARPDARLCEAALRAELPLLLLPPDTSHLALSRLVAEKNLANAAHVLQYGVTVHHTLGEVLYRGAGLGAMANQVRRISGCSVLLLDTQLGMLVSDLSGADDADLADQVADRLRRLIGTGGIVPGQLHGKATAVEVSLDAQARTVVCAPIVLGGTTYGWLLLIEADQPPRRHDLAQHLVLAGEAATITGSEMLRLRSVEAAEERARGDFVHALLHGRFSSRQEVESRASHHGFDMGGDYGVVAVQGAFDTSTPSGLERQSTLIGGIRRMRSPAGPPVLATAVGDLLVVVVQVAAGPRAGDLSERQAVLDAFAANVAAEVHRRTRRPIVAAFGRPASGPGGVADSYREARIALGVAQRLGIQEPCGYADLHAYAALTELTGSSRALAFATEVLQPLRQQDRPGEGLLKVVLTYVEAGGNVNAAARRLHLHRNTMFSKLERASRLLRLDLREPEAMFTIWLAHRIDLLANVEAEVSAEVGPARPAVGAADQVPGESEAR